MTDPALIKTCDWQSLGAILHKQILVLLKHGTSTVVYKLPSLLELYVLAPDAGA